MTLAIIGWTVVHALWQCSLIAGVTALALGLARSARPELRYRIGSCGLLLMFTASLVTFATASGVERLEVQRLLYAFDGALMIPEITPNGATILQVAGALWALGMAVGIANLLRSARRLHQLRAGDGSHVEPSLRAELTSLCGELAISKSVDVRSSTLANVPMVMGWRQSLIVMPRGAVRQLSVAQRRAILAHELAHVQRSDVLANVGQVLLDVVLFFHPAARWVSARVRTEREYCCDDVAVRVARDPVVYARALAILEDARPDCRLAVAAGSGTLLDRVRRVVGEPRPVLTPVRAALMCGGALLISAVLLAVTLNVPGPSVPPGVRMRRPNPAALPSRPPVNPAAVRQPR